MAMASIRHAHDPLLVIARVNTHKRSVICPVSWPRRRWRQRPSISREPSREIQRERSYRCTERASMYASSAAPLRNTGQPASDWTSVALVPVRRTPNMLGEGSRPDQGHRAFELEAGSRATGPFMNPSRLVRMIGICDCSSPRTRIQSVICSSWVYRVALEKIAMESRRMRPFVGDLMWLPRAESDPDPHMCATAAGWAFANLYAGLRLRPASRVDPAERSPHWTR